MHTHTLDDAAHDRRLIQVAILHLGFGDDLLQQVGATLGKYLIGRVIARFPEKRILYGMEHDRIKLFGDLFIVRMLQVMRQLVQIYPHHFQHLPQSLDMNTTRLDGPRHAALEVRAGNKYAFASLGSAYLFRFERIDISFLSFMDNRIDIRIFHLLRQISAQSNLYLIPYVPDD